MIAEIDKLIAKLRRYTERATQDFDGRDEWFIEAASALEGLAAENARLRAALAQSELPCVYCSLPREEWAKCSSGFPGCDRADDAVGCPELGARLRAEAAEAANAELQSALEKAKEPDFFWPYDDPESTFDSAEEVMRELAACGNEVIRVATGKSLESRWLANRVVSLHEGEPDEVEVASFENQSDAMVCFTSSLAALRALAALGEKP